MSQFKNALVVLLQITLAGLLAWFISLWTGSLPEILAFTYGVLLFWHMFIGVRTSRLESAVTDQTDVNQGTSGEQSILELIHQSHDALPNGVILLDAENKVIWANTKAEEYLGVNKFENKGDRIESLLHQLHFVDLGRKLSSDTGTEAMEIVSPLNESVSLRLQFFHFSQGNRLIFVQDMSQIHRVARMRQDFIGNASHELRTPLTVIRGYLEEMSDDHDLPAYWEQPVAAMSKQTLRMQNIIEDMLTLSNIESRLSLAGNDKVHVSSLARQVSTDIQQAFQKSHSISQNIPDDLYIKGEENELYSILSNLVKNAFLYSAEGTEIQIQWKDTEADGQLIVTDQGIGIPEESLRRLTERFYRVDSDRSRERGGTGLGLAIVKHALMRHEAYLDIKSQIGAGSRFICNFPLSRVVKM